MLLHRDIARALIIESYTDLQAARALLNVKIYARCMAHCQQSVEKALKAALAVRDVIVTDRHDVSEDFRETYADWALGSELADIAAATESIGFRTEYPLFGRRDMPVWIPSQQYNDTDANDFLQKATHVFEAVEADLASKYNIHGH
jgi:HEPN domain-containing protein